MAQPVPLPPTVPSAMPVVPIRPKWNLGPRLKGLGALTTTHKGLIATAAIGVVLIGGILWLWKK